MGPHRENTQKATDPDLRELSLPLIPSTSLPSTSLPPTSLSLARVPHHTIGATGRIWSMPAPYILPTHPQDAAQFFPTNDSCRIGLLRFLDAYAPQLLASWSSSLHPVKDDHARLIMSLGLSTIRTEGALHIAPEHPCQPAPRDIELPSLDRNHWAWGAHYELGRCKSMPDNMAQDCAWEASDDLGHISFYLERYRALAQEYSGSRLEEATWAPQFRGPYYTCMDICLGDLRLPSHFIALIHYGIAAQMIHIASPVKSAMPVLSRLTEMYCEDFAG